MRREERTVVGEMLIRYIGHACFKIRDNETGYSIMIDPYQPDSVRGFGKIVDTASEILCSHEHFDHNSRESVVLEPRDDSPFIVEVIDGWHDDRQGDLRGPNRIYVITEKSTGTKLIHYGDTGQSAQELLTDENVRLLRDADVALIPVGGTYTIDADEAIELIRKTSPSIAVPMHFRIDAAPIGLENIGSIEDFITKAQKAGMNIRSSSVSFYDTSLISDEKCILALRPSNM